MPLIPARQNRSRWKAAIPFIGMLVLFLIVIGFMTDLWFGFPLLLSARSWTTWLFGILALGVLYFLGEGGSEWLRERNKVSHSLWKRVWNLTLLLGFVGAIAVIVMVVIRIAQRP